MDKTPTDVLLRRMFVARGVARGGQCSLGIAILAFIGSPIAAQARFGPAIGEITIIVYCEAGLVAALGSLVTCFYLFRVAAREAGSLRRWPRPALHNFDTSFPLAASFWCP